MNFDERRLPFKRRPLPRRPQLRPFATYDFETDPIPRIRSDAMKPKPRYLTMYGPDLRLSIEVRSSAALAPILRSHFFTPDRARWRYCGWNANRFDVYFILDAIVEHIPELIASPYVAGSGNLRGVRVMHRQNEKLYWELLDGMAMTGQTCTQAHFVSTFAPQFPKLDGSEIVLDFDPANELHRAYAERDAESLWHALSEVESILVRLTGRGMAATIGKVGIQYFHSRLPEDVLVWRPKQEHLEIIRDHVVRGGYVECRKQFTGNAYKYDVNQAYLGIGMRRQRLPCGQERSTETYVPGACAIYHVELYHAQPQPIGFYCSLIAPDERVRTVSAIARDLCKAAREGKPNPLAGVRVSPTLIFGDDRLQKTGARRVQKPDALGRSWWIAGEYSSFRRAQLQITPAQRLKMKTTSSDTIEGNLDQLAADAGVGEIEAIDLLLTPQPSIADFYEEAAALAPLRSQKGVTRGERVQTWITSIEYETLRRWGWHIELLPGSWYWTDSFSMSEFVDELEAARMSCPGGPAGPTGTMLKAIGVNAYGKTGERIPAGRTIICAENPTDGDRRFINAAPEDPLKKYFWWEIALRDEDPAHAIERVYHRPQIAAFVTAAVRMELYDQIMHAPENFIACDTDSLLFDREADWLPIHPSKYGAYKCEASDSLFIVVGKKAYMDVAAGKITYKGLRVKELSEQMLRDAIGPAAVIPSQEQVQLQSWKKGLGAAAPMYAAAKRRGTDFGRSAPHTIESATDE